MARGQYDGSHEFTDDMLKMKEALLIASNILNKPEFADWMQKTDQNYGSQFEARLSHQELKQEVQAVSDKAELFCNHIIELDE